MSKSKVNRYIMLDGVSQYERINDALKKLGLDAISYAINEVNKLLHSKLVQYFGRASKKV